MPVLGFSALMIRPGEQVNIPKRSASGVLKIVDGHGQADIDGASFDWDQHDILAVPTHSAVALSNGSTEQAAYVFLVDDAPLQRKSGIYEVFD